MRYMAGFHILHRYAYVVIPADGDPVAVFPREATWVGDHSATFLQNRELPPHCGEWMADFLARKGARKVGSYGYEYIINVRDYSPLAAKGFELINFDIPFDYARAQKSDEELASVRHSMEINKQGVLAVIRAYEPGRTEAELMGVAEQVFAAAGCARNTMDMVQMGPNGSLRPQMVFPTNRPAQANDGMLYGFEISGEGGHWVEYSRPLMPEGMDAVTADMMAAHRGRGGVRAAGKYGLLHAIEAWCPHMGNYMPNGFPPGRPLADLLHGDEIECPFHGWRFSGQGECTRVPRAQRTPPAVADGRTIIRCWVVREENGQIQLGTVTQGCVHPPLTR